MRIAIKEPVISWKVNDPGFFRENWMWGGKALSVPTLWGANPSPKWPTRIPVGTIWERVDQLLVLGMVIQPLIGNPYNGYINPYYWVDDHPLYGNNGSLDPSTFKSNLKNLGMKLGYPPKKMEFIWSYPPKMFHSKLELGEIFFVPLQNYPGPTCVLFPGFFPERKKRDSDHLWPLLFGWWNDGILTMEWIIVGFWREILSTNSLPARFPIYFPIPSCKCRRLVNCETYFGQMISAVFSAALYVMNQL